MSINFKLHDFVPDYLPDNSLNIQYDINKRYEFSSLVNTENDTFTHQDIILRYMKIYDKVLNINETGTGKTGVMVKIAEYYKNHSDEIKRTYIIIPGEQLEKQTKNQIIKLGESPEYKNITSVTNRNKILDEWYTIKTFKGMEKELSQLSDKYLKKNYSNILFIIDEFHKITTDEENSKSNLDFYNQLWRLFHIIKNSKILISTATPMTNNVNDIIPVLNLINPKNKQLPTNIDYSSISYDSLKPFLNGKITYVKKIEKNIIPYYEGEELKIEKCKVHSIVLEDFNYYDIYINEKKVNKIKINSYKEAIDYINFEIIKNKYNLVNMYYDYNNLILNYEDTETVMTVKVIDVMLQPVVGVFSKKELKIEEFQQRRVKLKKKEIDTKQKVVQIQMSDYQYSIYKKQSSKFFRTYQEKASFIVNQNNDNLEFDNSLFDIENKTEFLKTLKNTSCKLSYFIEKELSFCKKEKPGKSFCYLHYINLYGGVITKILDKFGFVKFEGSNVEKKGKRYALLESKTEILDVFNSEKNIHGEYIQLIILGPKSREGINLDSILRCYILQPYWNESGTLQAISRAIRATSHDRLLKENPDKKIKISIYKLAAVYKDVLTSDIDMYYNSEKKDISIQIMMEKLKRSAFDAYLNMKRNGTKSLLEKDKGSYYFKDNFNLGYFKDMIEVKDFMYKYNLNFPIKNINNYNYMNFKTYNLFYSEEQINKYYDKIIYDITNDKFSDIGDIILKNEENIYIIIKALMRIKSEPPVICFANKFKKMCIKIMNNCAFPSEYTQISSNKATVNIDYVIDVPFNITVIKKENVEENIQLYLKDKSLKEIKESIYKNSINNRKQNILILEYFLINKKEKFHKDILNIFDFYIYKFKNPFNWISFLKTYYRYSTLQNLKLPDNPGSTTEDIICHLYNEGEGGAFVTTSNFSNVLKLNKKVVRMYDKEKEEFVNSDIYYKRVILELFTQRLINILEEINQKRSPIGFGTIMGDNKFRIHKNVILKQVDDFTEIQFLGKECESFKKEDLKNILDFIQNKKNITFDKTIYKNKKFTCNEIIKYFEEENLLYRYI